MEKTKGQQLAEQLFYKTRTAGDCLPPEQIAQAEDFCRGYAAFIGQAKTEREAVQWAVGQLEAAGFVPLQAGRAYQPGEKVYRNVRDRALLAAVIGRQPLAGGVNIAASHVDSPRLDLKPQPLYEESDLAFFKTHHYGGIKKYQWGALPLALHGVVIDKQGRRQAVALGEQPDEPVFCVTDLLPHLAKDQMNRTLKEGLKGEELNVLVGGYPFRDDKQSERVKLNILALLHEKYGWTEADFLSAELCLVPAFGCREVGLDRAFLGCYGHDDRVCAYTSMMALLQAEAPERTAVCVLADKEETGSNGISGLQSDMLRFFIEDLAAPHGLSGRQVLMASKCLSADVNAAYDPTFADAYDKRNSAYAGHGVVITKYTGGGGKGDTNDATAEFMAETRCMLDEAGVQWQTGELGKVDQGGGGTVAKFIAELGVDTVDIGVPVLSMHAPFEVVAKTDVYMTYRAFAAFYR